MNKGFTSQLIVSEKFATNAGMGLSVQRSESVGMRGSAEPLKVYILNDTADIKGLIEAWSGLGAITVFLDKAAPERIARPGHLGERFGKNWRRLNKIPIGREPRIPVAQVRRREVPQNVGKVPKRSREGAVGKRRLCTQTPWSPRHRGIDLI